MRHIILLLFLLIAFAPGFAQSNNAAQRVIPPSPNAAALGKFVEQPVDLCNGLVKIEIPLYTIKSRSLELPISLSYHSGGVKVDEKASWVGLSWVLNAGGVLNRSIRGKSDENGHLHQTYTTTMQLYQATDGEVVYNFLDARAKGTIDNESDMYSYNATGISGSFQYTTSHELVQIPLTDNKIEDNPGVSYTITSDNGTKYIFDVIETSLNQVTSQGNEPTSFYLSKIISADAADTVYFDYTNGGNSSNDNTVSFNIVDNTTINSSTFSGPINGIITHAPKILQKIRFAGGYIDLTTSNSNQTISEIKVYTNDNVLRQSFKLEYTTWSSRLMLSEAKMLDNAGNQVGKYSMTYNTTYTMPDYYVGINQSNLYYGQDLWGYYNGVTTNTSFLTQTPYSSYNSDRNPNETYAQAGILTGITYPTGGKSTFTYELNNSGMPVGGLRIKKIETYADATATPITKNYTYSVGYSAGNLSYLNAINNYHYSQVEIPLCPEGICPPPYTNETPVLKEYYASNPTLPLSFNSNTAFYADITETATDQSDIPLGKTEYEFEAEQDDVYPTNVTLPNIPFTLTPRYTSYVTSLSWSRGQLKNRQIYKRESNGSFTLIHSEANQYDHYRSNTFTVGINVFKQLIYPFGEAVSSSPASIEISKYQFFDILNYTWSKKLKSTTTTEYANGLELQTTTDYTYGAVNNSSNYHFNVTKVETTNSKGETVKKTYKYPADFAGGAVADGMLQKNMKSIVVSEIENISNVDNSGHFTVFGTLTGGVSPNTYNMYLPVKVQNYYQGAGFQDEIMFDIYDEKANLKQFHKVSDINTSYIWDYDKKYPVAEVKNATSQNVAYTSFEADGTGNWTINGGSSNTGYSFTGQKSYTISTGNTITKTGLPSNNYIVSYWSKNGSLSVNSGTGTTGVTIGVWTYYVHILTSVTSSTVSTTGNHTIDDLRLYPADAQMTTYTYNPLIGLTSQSDVNSLPTYYIYDAFNRLSIIRDKDFNIIKQYCYNYSGQTENCTLLSYTNDAKSGNFTRNNCSSGTGSTVTYTVPAGTIVSYKSKEDANQKAQDDVNNNGQAYANANGTCTITCSFSALSGFSIAPSSISSVNNTVSFSLTFVPGSTMNLGTEYMVAAISTGCRPVSNKTMTLFFGGSSFFVTIYASTGQVGVRPISGGNVPSGTQVTLSGTYDNSL